MGARSGPRNNGTVVTATQPALIAPSQQAISVAVLGPRNNTLLPGTRPSVSIRPAMRAARSPSSAYVQEPQSMIIAVRVPRPYAIGESISRSEESRVGKECGGTGQVRGGR